MARFGRKVECCDGDMRHARCVAQLPKEEDLEGRRSYSSLWESSMLLQVATLNA
jgi:hypothetical protein